MTLLWAGVFGGPVAWTFHILMSYLVVAMACRGGWTTELVLAAGGAVAILHALTVVAVLGALGAGAAAWASWRRPETAGHRGLAAVGMGMAALFLAVIVVEATAPLFLAACP